MKDRHHTPDTAEFFWMDDIWHIPPVLSHSWFCDRNGIQSFKNPTSAKSPYVLLWNI